MATKKNLPKFDEYEPYSDLQPYRGTGDSGSNIPLNSKAQYVSLGNAGSYPGVNNDYNTLPEKYSYIDPKGSLEPHVGGSGNNGGGEDPYSNAIKELMEKLNGLKAPTFNFGYGDFNSRWEPIRNDLYDRAAAMNYEDWTAGSDYASLANRYSNAGRAAMQDTLGQVAARTGGLASSYAGTVSQQAYNNYMNQLDEASRNMYNYERNNLLNEAQQANAYLGADYDRWNADREYAYDIAQQNYKNAYNAYSNQYDALVNQLQAISKEAGGNTAGKSAGNTPGTAANEAEYNPMTADDLSKYLKDMKDYDDNQKQSYIELLNLSDSDKKYLYGAVGIQSKADSERSAAEESIGTSKGYNKAERQARIYQGDAEGLKNMLITLAEGGTITVDEAAYLYSQYSGSKNGKTNLDPNFAGNWMHILT